MRSMYKKWRSRKRNPIRTGTHMKYICDDVVTASEEELSEILTRYARSKEDVQRIFDSHTKPKWYAPLMNCIAGEDK